MLGCASTEGGSRWQLLAKDSAGAGSSARELASTSELNLFLRCCKAFENVLQRGEIWQYGGTKEENGLMSFLPTSAVRHQTASARFHGLLTLRVKKAQCLLSTVLRI